MKSFHFSVILLLAGCLVIAGCQSETEKRETKKVTTRIAKKPEKEFGSLEWTCENTPLQYITADKLRKCLNRY